MSSACENCTDLLLAVPQQTEELCRLYHGINCKRGCDLARQRDSALARAEAAEKERDEALADGVLSQRMCDVLNERDAYRSMLCDVLASHRVFVGARELWGRVRSILKHGPVIPSRAAEPT